MLDSPERRSNNNGQRRALVHNHQDGLTINYAKDYPGGVAIQGEVSLETAKVQGSLLVGAEIKVQNNTLVRLKDPGTNAKRLVLGQTDAPNAIEVEGRGMQINGGFQVRGDAIFDQSIRVKDVIIDPPAIINPPAAPGSRIRPELRPELRSIRRSLNDVISGLQEKIAQLESRIAQLEG